MTSAERLFSTGDEAASSLPDGVRAGQARVVLGQDAGGAEVKWHVSTKGSPHAFIIGIPGQGKSVTPDE